MQIVPNLHFNGDCEQAIELYERAFHTKRTVFLRNHDANPEDTRDEPGETNPTHVLHAEMLIGGQRVMFNDHTGGIPHGLNVSLLVSFDSKEDVIAAYEALKDGATILVPAQETSYSSCFISLVDRHGVRWELIKEIQ